MKRFNINLQTGPRLHQDEINLHLSVRGNEEAIIRNHFTRNDWGAEERYGGCPIRPFEDFTILILAESTGFKVR